MTALPPPPHGGGRLRHCPRVRVPRFTSPPFFSDCVHELHPVTAGARLCLLYNLVLAMVTAGGGGSVVPRALRGCPSAARVRHVLRTWAAKACGAACGHLVLRLMHKCTGGRLSMKALEPRDAALANILLSEKDPSGAPVFEKRLAVLHKRVVGAMYGDPYEEMERYHQKQDYDDEEGEVDSDVIPVLRVSSVIRIDDVEKKEVEVDAWVTL